MNRIFAAITGFRKFIVIMSYMSIMILFRVFDLVNGAEFASNLQLAVVAYCGANIGEHFVDAAKEWLKNKSKEIKSK